jgi:hypothetical protein
MWPASLFAVRGPDLMTGLPQRTTGNRQRMTTPDLTGDHAVSEAFASRPAMPSIAASALLESRMLIERTRRTVADWLTRTGWTQ